MIKPRAEGSFTLLPNNDRKTNAPSRKGWMNLEVVGPGGVQLLLTLAIDAYDHNSPIGIPYTFGIVRAQEVVRVVSQNEEEGLKYGSENIRKG